MSFPLNFLSVCLFVILTLLSFPSYGFVAQNTANPPSQGQLVTPKKLLDPDMVELSGRNFMTSDGVLLSGAFYPGNADKETIPIILLHGQGKSREEFAPLIEEMKKRGYAVLAFDFRGHGESTTRFSDPREDMQPENMVQPPTPPQPPKPIQYLAKDFKRADYENMYKFDTLPFYRFLVQQNNAERLNLNKLVIIGVDMGGTVGGQMTKQLWANSRGKNVRSLVIVSPNYDPFSKTLLKDAKCFHKNVPLLMIVGQLDRQSKENALSLRDEILGKEKRRDDDPTSMSSPVPIAEFPTERQGGELLKESKLGIPQKIADYINMTLTSHSERDLRWRKM